MKKIFDKQKPMKNKIVMKNKKFRFVFKDVDEKKFMKVHKYLTRLQDTNSVQKMINMKKKFEQQELMEQTAPEPEEDYSSEHENYEEKSYE